VVHQRFLGFVFNFWLFSFLFNLTFTDIFFSSTVGENN